MNLKLHRQAFLEKLTVSSRFTSSKLSSMSSLQGVLLKGEENQINFYSTNLSYSYCGKLKYEGSHKFQFMIEPKKVMEFLSLLEGSDLSIDIKDKSLIISQEKTVGEFPFLAVPVSEFPLPPEVKGKKQTIKTSFLKDNLSLLLFSTSSDEARPVLTGINFVSDEDRLQLVSTDGFRLSLLTLKKEYDLPSMIIPSGFLSEAFRIVGDKKEISINFMPEEKLLAFFLGSDELYTRLIEGEFPPFDRVIPSEKKTTITVDKEELMRGVKLISVFARDQSNIIIISTGKGELKLNPKTGDGEKNVATVEAGIEGEPQKIAFNFKFLIDFLNNTSGKKIIIELLRSDSPAVFKVEGAGNFFHIIMPVRLQE